MYFLDHHNNSQPYPISLSAKFFLWIRPKRRAIFLGVTFGILSTTSLIWAGEPEAKKVVEPEADPWITPLIDIRLRYEFADLEGFDDANAWTVRERVGFETKGWQGFSALVEGEFSQALGDDYHAGAPGAHPFDPRRSLIADPETVELNQAYLSYEGFDTVIRAGRQRIIYDNAAFIGNVGWRQNEQTYDALSFVNESIDGLTLRYAYVNQVNRIFGSDADAPLGPGFSNVQDIDARIHLLNGTYTGLSGVTLGGYAYLMDFPDYGTWNNNTFGLSAKTDLWGLTWYGEFAWQDKAGVGANDEAYYAHGTVTKDLKNDTGDWGKLTLGVEHLDAGFKTPLATVHTMNGFADVTDAARVSGGHNGLTDSYISHVIPIFWGIQWTNVMHIMGDNEISDGYGWEYDSVLTKKFNEQFTGIAKFAYFNSEGDDYTANAIVDRLPDATRFSLELNYHF